MCDAPERLCAHFPRVITTIMDHKVQLLKPLNLVSCILRSRTNSGRVLCFFFNSACTKP
jgi:hypothetical protein